MKRDHTNLALIEPWSVPESMSFFESTLGTRTVRVGYPLGWCWRVYLDCDTDKVPPIHSLLHYLFHLVLSRFYFA
jgi:hypothetical protein